MFASPEVRYCSVEGITVLMSLRSGDYSLLDRRGSAIWNALLDAPETLPLHVDTLSAEWRLSCAQIQSEIETFAEDCIRQGFLLRKLPAAPQLPAPRPNRSARFLLPRAWWSLISTLARLRRGFPGAYQRLALTRVKSASSAQEILPAALSAFRMAENFVNLPNAPRDCLPRSMALFHFLKELGVPVQHCIGVRRFPFEAHAWVECHGAPLFNDPADLLRYTELARTP